VVEPLGVGDDARFAVDPVGAELLQDAAGVAPLDEVLRHDGHVHRDDTLAASLMLRRPVIEPRRLAPGERSRVGFDAGTGVPVGRLPPAHVAEVRSLRLEPLVPRRELGVARRAHGATGIVALVYQTKRLDGPGGAVARIALV